MNKLRREMIRVGLGLLDAARAPVDAVGRRAHDRAFDPARAVIMGYRPLTPKLAVLVTWQPGGMPASVFETCRHLDATGYAVLLVANAPLSSSDHDSLLPLCWGVLERPNRGYDFGGYRDGIRLLGDRLAGCDSLVLMNDSVWMPILPDSDMLAELEADPAPFTGVALEKRAGRSARRWHQQSFLLQFKPAALQSDVFRDYWQEMRLSDLKRVVLKHGEKGLSQAMFRAGFGGEGLATRARLLAALEEQDNAFLRQTLAYAAYEDQDALHEGQALLARFQDNEDWRRDVLAHMRRMLAWLPFAAVFGFAAIRLLGVAYMKKTSGLRVYGGMRWQYLRALQAGDLPAPSPAILAEIRASRRDGRLTTAPDDAPR